jgi:DNA-binding CsgD family transcriptional regulator
MARRASRGTRARKRSLSAREKEVLSLLSQGLTGVEIAERLYLSPETVRTHVRNAMTKLNASTRAHAIALAIKDGEISLEQI